jgi:hypothetical protein
MATIFTFNYSSDFLPALRTASLWAFFATYFVLIIIHGQLLSFLLHLHSVFIFLSMIPTSFVLIPMFSFWHLDDLSWGNRDAKDNSTAAEQEGASRYKRVFFFGFAMANSVVFVIGRLIMEPVAVSRSVSDVVVIIFVLFLIFASVSVLIFSILNAFRRWITALIRWNRKRKEKKAKTPKEKKGSVSPESRPAENLT